MTQVETAAEGSQLLAGAARADITPPVGADLGGFYTRIQPSIAVRDPLTATALSLRQGAERLVIVSCDLLNFRGDMAIGVRERIGRAAGIDPSRVLLACSHTHSGPALGAHLRTSLNSSSDILGAYTANLIHTLCGLVQQASRTEQPARLKPSHGASDIGINRRERLPSGRIIIGLNESGPRDPEVGVVRIDTAGSEPLAVMVNYACHPIVQGPQSRAISADFPGAMRDLVEEATGALCLFFQGAAGDQGPVSGVDAGFGAVERLGRMLGHEVAKVHHGIETPNVRMRPEVFESVAPLRNLIPEVLPDTPAPIEVAEETVQLPLRTPPSRQEVEDGVLVSTRAAEEARARGDAPVELSKLEVQAAWYAYMHELYAAGTVPEAIEVRVQSIRIGPLGIVAMPVEPFVGIGLAIKQRSPAPFTWVVGYANGCAAYVPSPESYAEGGYEIENSYKLYKLPAPIAPEGFGRLIESGGRLLDSLFLAPVPQGGRL